jgi:hypothetical protein
LAAKAMNIPTISNVINRLTTTILIARLTVIPTTNGYALFLAAESKTTLRKE